jgi:uncharacterized repeat protein (TIGR03803 family)
MISSFSLGWVFYVKSPIVIPGRCPIGRKSMSFTLRFNPQAVVVTFFVCFMAFVPVAWTQNNYKSLHKFTVLDGNAPEGPVISDAAGNIYGTTAGSQSGYGIVFELTQNTNGTWKETVLHRFQGTDGSGPFGSLTFDAPGNLYGTTQFGGANQQGTVFKLSPDGNGRWRETVLYSFCSISSCTDGALPLAGLNFDQAGNLYGTTLAGGSGSSGCTTSGCGTVFELMPQKNGRWSERVLYNFCSQTGCPDGANPSTELIFDQAGNLYGTTRGSNGFSLQGVAFELKPNGNRGWTESVLYQFCSQQGCLDGAGPYAGLILDQVGNLYGTTYAGGTYDAGIAFQLTPNSDGTWTENVLHSFQYRDGNTPAASLTPDRSGNLYGTTVYGGSKNWGVVFKLSPNSGGWQETVLHNFLDHPGARPTANVTFAPDGNLRGTTSGSIRNVGNVFEVVP